MEVKGNRISFDVEQDFSVKIKDYFSVIKEITYIDDPFVLDNLSKASWYGVKSQFSHRDDLLKKIILGNGRDPEHGILDEVFVEKKLNKIFEIMQDICDGDLVKTDDGRGFVYKTDKLNDYLDIVNLSTGLKSFVILRTLIKKGIIDENGIIILDEPEIHLHPEWQLRFAEIIILLQKEFKMNILLNTHSPYFLNAIEVYSKKYEISKNCKYYLTEELKTGKTIINDVTENRELIYKKLARPLQKLESLEYEV